MMLRVERVGTESMQMEDAEACACDVLFVRKESPFAYGSPRSATVAHHFTLTRASYSCIQYGFSSTWSLGSRR